MVEAKIVNLAVTDKGFAIILKPKGNEKVIPIFVGTIEAQSISMVMLGLSQPRPLAHDLIKEMLNRFSVRLEKVIIDDLRSETFFAKLVLIRDDVAERIDARPSDAIAVALRTKSPIFIEEKVIEAAGILLEGANAKIFKDSIPGHHETDEQPAPEGEASRTVLKTKKEQLTAMLDEAVREERYEDAATLRDELNKLSFFE
ncbi:MAG: bifunctional nuclease family protein [Spirochaetes bacterium]|nr:bifunctional nuclease family protein [Spirochaetota bacterium]